MSYDPFEANRASLDAEEASHHLEDDHPSGAAYHEAAVVLTASVDALVAGAEDVAGNELRESWLHDEIERTDAAARWAAFECLTSTLLRWATESGHDLNYGALVEHHPIGIPDELSPACQLIAEGFTPHLDDAGGLSSPPFALLDPSDGPDEQLDYSDPVVANAEEMVWFAAALHVFWGTLSLVACGTGATFTDLASALPSYGEHPGLPSQLGADIRADWLDRLADEAALHSDDLTLAVTTAFTEPDLPDRPFAGFDLIALEDHTDPAAVEALRDALQPTNLLGGGAAPGTLDDDSEVLVLHQRWAFTSNGRSGVAACTMAFVIADGFDGPSAALHDYDTVVFAVDGPLFPNVWVASGAVAAADDPVRAAVAETLQRVKYHVPLSSLWGVLTRGTPAAGQGDDEPGDEVNATAGPGDVTGPAH